MSDPAKIKQLCKKEFHSIDSDTKQHHVKQGMLLKYGQNEYLRDALKDTLGTTLAEANPFDKFWGIGASLWKDSSFNPNTWEGSNVCGKLLMEVRDELSAQYGWE